MILPLRVFCFDAILASKHPERAKRVKGYHKGIVKLNERRSTMEMIVMSLLSLISFFKTQRALENVKANEKLK